MQKISQLKTSVDSLKNNFERDKEIFGIGMTNSHPLKRLPNLNYNGVSQNNKPIFDYMESKNKYELINVLQNSEGEVDILLRQINNKKKSYFLQQKLINLHKITLYDKYALIFASLLLFIIGSSLGAIIRKGGLGLPIVLSVSIFLLYHYIGLFSKNAAEDNSISPLLASWISTIILAPFAYLLLNRASSDKGFMAFLLAENFLPFIGLKLSFIK